MINAGIDNTVDFEPIFKPVENPLILMERALVAEYSMNRKLSSVVDTVKQLRAMIEGFLNENTGFDTGKMTLAQLDKIVISIALGLVTHNNLLVLQNVPVYVRALILIDGVLKPHNIEVHGGYQNARLSYIPEANLNYYYSCLDNARTLNSKRPLAFTNKAVSNYYDWTRSIKD